MSQHIVNVAFDFDDDKVRKILEESAEKKVLDTLTNDIKKSICEESSGYYGYRSDLTDKNFNEGLKSIVRNKTEKVLLDYKDEIIELAAKYLAEKLSRTKAAKELLNK